MDHDDNDVPLENDHSDDENVCQNHSIASKVKSERKHSSSKETKILKKNKYLKKDKK